MTVSIVVPCFNEEETLSYTHETLLKVFSPLPYRFVEIIYVNDGSTDRTSSLLQRFYREHSEAEKGVTVTVLEFSRNFGHSAAVLAGLSKAKGDVVGILDADLQDPPELLPKMIDELKEADVVYGKRTRRERETPLKKVTAWMFYRALNLLAGFEIPRDTGDFRVMTRSVRHALLECGETDPFIRGLVAWIGFRQKAFPYERKARKYGQTKYPFRKMLRFASLAILSFSSKPLRIGIYIGVIGLSMTIGLMAWALYTWYIGDTVPGWTSLLGAFLGGAIVHSDASWDHGSLSGKSVHGSAGSPPLHHSC